VRDEWVLSKEDAPFSQCEESMNKAVPSAIPLPFLSCFLLPLSCFPTHPFQFPTVNLDYLLMQA